MTGARIEEPKAGYVTAVASIVGGSLMKVSYMQFLITDNVMAVYHDPGRWRHDGLQDLCKGVEGRIFLKFWRLTWTSPNQSGA